MRFFVEFDDHKSWTSPVFETREEVEAHAIRRVRENAGPITIFECARSGSNQSPQAVGRIHRCVLGEGGIPGLIDAISVETFDMP